jgi:hypothetical protein
MGSTGSCSDDSRRRKATGVICELALHLMMRRRCLPTVIGGKWGCRSERGFACSSQITFATKGASVRRYGLYDEQRVRSMPSSEQSQLTCFVYQLAILMDPKRSRCVWGWLSGVRANENVKAASQITFAAKVSRDMAISPRYRSLRRANGVLLSSPSRALNHFLWQPRLRRFSTGSQKAADLSVDGN